MVKKVDDIKKAVSELSRDQLKNFRDWYEKFDSNAWDEQIEKDATSGKLNVLAEAAIIDHKAGKSKKL